MIFLILTHVVHKKSEYSYYAYGPYLREMNLWIRHVDEVIIVAPLSENSQPEEIDIPYIHNNITFIRIPEFNLLGIKSIVRTLFLLPLLIFRISKGIKKADHIHIRCPGNVGLLACFVQIFFPHKKKTAKYASNWDWNIKQPWSYRLQQRILRNTFLTRNMTVLVYGEWPDRTKNIKPFFTASYSEIEKLQVSKKPLNEEVKLAFAGTLTPNKSPLTSLLVLKEIIDKGINASLTVCGDGPERVALEERIIEYNLQNHVVLTGNVNAEKVKEVLKESHFLIFMSRSEGWPKAVSEAMWWGCVPVTTPVSCVPWMLGNGSRGELVENNAKKISRIIESYLSDQARFDKKSEEAMEWSREYTLEKFEAEIEKLLLP